MPTTIADAVSEYRTALCTAAALVIDDDDVLTLLGRPGPDYPNDVVWVDVPTGDLAAATMSPNRPRELTLTCDVIFSIYRPGSAEVEQEITTRAFDLFSRLEAYTRLTNTELDGVCRWCMCTGFSNNGGVQIDTESEADGRYLDLIANFVAPVRLTNA